MNLEMSGKQYALLVCSYIHRRYADRGVRIYREVLVGKSIIGKDRRIDILVHHPESNRALAIECKYQNSTGTADEKIPYALDDIRAMRMTACIVYAGQGFSTGILHMLRASDMAAYCLPGEDGSPSDDTKELDHILAMAFGWWDIVLDESRRFVPTSETLGLDQAKIEPVIAGKRRGPKRAETPAEEAAVPTVDTK
jgi:hypothetical protein